jgi:hypothetical protein
MTGAPPVTLQGREENWAGHSGVWGVEGIQGKCGTVSQAAATRSFTDKLLANPHSTLRRGSCWQNLRAQLEPTRYDKGEKWWGLDGAANPNLTVQQPLLDGAEGKLVDSTAKDNRTDSHTGQPGMAIGKFFSGLDDGTVVDPPVASTWVLGSGS